VLEADPLAAEEGLELVAAQHELRRVAELGGRGGGSI
jgi:hypothetical protein